MELQSNAFAANSLIPGRSTCDGEGISPDLRWGEPPVETQSLVLIVEDPDSTQELAGKETFVHWVVYDIPPQTRELPAAIPPNQPTLEGGARQGTNDFGGFGYGPPCPQQGMHRYVFNLYALDAFLGLDVGATQAMVEQAMAGHAIAQAELIGRYERIQG